MAERAGDEIDRVLDEMAAGEDDEEGENGAAPGDGADAGADDGAVAPGDAVATDEAIDEWLAAQTETADEVESAISEIEDDGDDE